MKIVFILACAVLVSEAQNRTSEPQRPFIVQCEKGTYSATVYPPEVLDRRTIIRSYNFGKGDYSNNDRCTITFVTFSKPLVLRLYVGSFNLEFSQTCAWDFVCIHGSHYCGREIENSTFAYSVPSNSTFTVRFYSDSSITKPGFQIVVDAVVDEEDRKEYYEDRCQESVTSPPPYYDLTTSEEPPTNDYWYGTGDYPWDDAYF